MAIQLKRMLTKDAPCARITEASKDFAANKFNVNTINKQFGDLYAELSR